MEQETTNKASNFSPPLSSNQTKQSNSGNFSLKSVVAIAQTTSDVHRREQQKLRKEEQELMKIVNESLQARHRHYRMGFPPNHLARDRKRTPPEWRPPEPKERGKRFIHGHKHTWNETRQRWEQVTEKKSKRVPHEWRPPEPGEDSKRIIHGRPHTWNERRNGWDDDTRKIETRDLSRRNDRERQSSRKRPRTSFTSYQDLQYAGADGSTKVTKHVSFSENKERRVVNDGTDKIGVDDFRGETMDPIQQLSNLQSKLGNLEEENTMWKQRYELLKKEYEEQMEKKSETEKDSQNRLDDLQYAIADANAKQHELLIEKNNLEKHNSKLSADLATQVAAVEAEQKNSNRLKREKEELEATVEDLENDNQVYSKRWNETRLELEKLKEMLREKDDSHRQSLQALVDRHQKELETSQTASKSNPVDAMRWKEELERKIQENADLQHNFNTMAMQSVRQSSTIEEQRHTIQRLRVQLDAVRGNGAAPLKVED